MTLHLSELKVKDFFHVSNVWILHNICYKNLNNSSSLHQILDWDREAFKIKLKHNTMAKKKDEEEGNMP